MGIGAHHLLSGSKGCGCPAPRLCKSVHSPVGNVVVLEKHVETVHLAILGTFTGPFWRMNTPSSCFFRSIRTVLISLLERVWNLERDMMGWRMSERPDSLFDNGDSEEVQRKGLAEHLQALLDMPPDLRAFFQAGEKQVPTSVRDAVRLGRMTALQKPNG